MPYESSSKDQNRILRVATSLMFAVSVIVLTAKDLTDEDRRVLSGRVKQIVEKGACSQEQVVDLIHQVVDHHAPATGTA